MTMYNSSAPAAIPITANTDTCIVSFTSAAGTALRISEVLVSAINAASLGDHSMDVWIQRVDATSGGTAVTLVANATTQTQAATHTILSTPSATPGANVQQQRFSVPLAGGSGRLGGQLTVGAGSIAVYVRTTAAASVRWSARTNEITE